MSKTEKKPVDPQFAYWAAEIGGEKQDRDVGHDNILGFWRIRGAVTKPMWPVLIHSSNGIIMVRVSGKEFPLLSDDGWDFRGSSWLKCEAVTRDAYKAAIENGWWHDGLPARHHKAETIESQSSTPGVGHNQPSEDPHQRLKDELVDFEDQAKELLKKAVDSQDAADKIGILISKLRDVASEADSHRKVEKAPILKAGKDIDAKWNAEITTPATDKSNELKQHLVPWLRKKKAEEEERAAKAREEEEKARLEALKNSEFASTPEQHRPAAETKAKRSTAGRTGAKVGLTTVTVGVVEDYKKACAYLLKIDHQDFKAFIDTLANRAAKANHPIPGVKFIEKDSVR